MNKTPYILDVPLSPEQDFKFLKQTGLDFISVHGGQAWNNLNVSDPGVTILDQVCFALSELGYCSNFSLPDILTGSDEKIITGDQFYPPGQILTTAPITARDYISYITDEVEAVMNAVIVPSFLNGSKIYQTWLLIKDQQLNQDADAICAESFHALNRCRNLGELFAVPVVLETVNVLLKGNLTLRQTNGLAKLFGQLQQQLDDHIFSPLPQKGFDELYAEGLPSEDILNGPALKNGWAGEAVKKDEVQAGDLYAIFNDNDSIAAAVLSGFIVRGDDRLFDEITVRQDQVIHIDLLGSIEKGMLTIGGKNSSFSPAEILPLLGQKSSVAKEPGLHPGVLNEQLSELPAGTYRDIASYYSIQNTFPEIFAAGADAVTSNATNYEVARSRQLKGYLTLFDQVLANQFAQLANIDKLFSFSNSSIAATGDKRYYDDRRVGQDIYPVPYKTFSPTYFYQSLYHVPHIRPLLKDHQVFELADSTVSPQQQEQKNWEAYKLDPYNSYIHGLQLSVDDETTNLERRNKILDHLLARHGESPLFIDTVIDGAEYTGDSPRDRVIIKSMLLQNLGILSYYRAKAMNFLATDPVERRLHSAHAYYELLLSGKRDLLSIEKTNKITERDMVNFCQVELRLNLLFGLKTQYDHYVLEHPNNDQEIRIAEWLTQQRRGSIVIETAVLNYFFNRQTVEAKVNDADDLLFFFPSFIPHFMTPGFRQRLNYFLQHSLPVGISFDIYFISSDTLLNLIPAWGNWINSIRHNNKNEDRSQQSSAKLMNIIQRITKTNG
jgi:hypothetical protein